MTDDATKRAHEANCRCHYRRERKGHCHHVFQTAVGDHSHPYTDPGCLHIQAAIDAAVKAAEEIGFQKGVAEDAEGDDDDDNPQTLGDA